MGSDHSSPRVSQHRLDGALPSGPRAPPTPSGGVTPPADPAPSEPTPLTAPTADNGALEERRRRWAIERARFEAAHPAPPDPK